MDELRERLAEKRASKAVEEAKENKANEALRRKAGKVRPFDHAKMKSINQARPYRISINSEKKPARKKPSRRPKPNGVVGSMIIGLSIFH